MHFAHLASLQCGLLDTVPEKNNLTAHWEYNLGILLMSSKTWYCLIKAPVKGSSTTGRHQLARSRPRGQRRGVQAHLQTKWIVSHYCPGVTHHASGIRNYMRSLLLLRGMIPTKAIHVVVEIENRLHSDSTIDKSSYTISCFTSGYERFKWSSHSMKRSIRHFGVPL